MYARLTTFHLAMNKHDKAVELYENSVIPEAKKQNGFRGAYFLANRNAGKFVSITLWDSMENAVENQKSGYYQRQIDKFDEFSVDAPDIEGFSVKAMAEK